jgi:uncharacterized integral membrane protein
VLIIGLLLLAAAIAAGVILVVQNDELVRVHAFDGSWQVHAYWLAVAGLAIMAVAVLGLLMMRASAARARRLRRERADLSAENRRLSERLGSDTGSDPDNDYRGLGWTDGSANAAPPGSVPDRER